MTKDLTKVFWNWYLIFEILFDLNDSQQNSDKNVQCLLIESA